MPTATLSDFLVSSEVLLFIKGAILLILAFYAIFALMVVRQVDLMGKTLITKASSMLKAFSILHAGVAIGLIILAWGIL